MFAVTVPLDGGDRQVEAPVTPPVEALLRLLVQHDELSSSEIRQMMNLKDRTHFRERYIDPAMTLKAIEFTISDKPKSRLQKYRLTDKGLKLIKGQA
jgi:ATP-dependent DNA helicase RecG